MRVNLTDIQFFTSLSVVIFGYFDVGHLQRNPLRIRQNRQRRRLRIRQNRQRRRLPHRTPRKLHQVSDETRCSTPNPALRQRLLKITLRLPQHRPIRRHNLRSPLLIPNTYPFAPKRIHPHTGAILILFLCLSAYFIVVLK